MLEVRKRGLISANTDNEMTNATCPVSCGTSEHNSYRDLEELGIIAGFERCLLEGVVIFKLVHYRMVSYSRSRKARGRSEQSV